MTDVHDPAARVRALCEYGLRSVEVDEHIPPNRYFKSGKEMIRMAAVYEEEGELEKAFILYNKFTTLFIEKLPKHPNYNKASKDDKQSTRKLLERVFPNAEALKKRLKEKYIAEENKRLGELKRKEEERQKLIQLQKKADEMRLKEEERHRQEMEMSMLREAEDEFWQLQLKEQQQLDLDQQRRLSDSASLSVNATSEEEAVLPQAVMPSAPPDAEEPQFAVSPPPDVLPPSYTSVVYVDQKPSIPSRNLKPTSTSTTTSVSTTSVSTTVRPEVDRTNKPFVDHFTSTGEAGLKTVFVPEELVTLFLHCALANSMRSIETCGILCGKLKNSQWHISHLLIPQQTGTTDSCDISNEEAVADFQDKYSLVVLGWIHTHPTQTAFLSSVDQHTHWPYQKLLPEAIAIVCSPKFNETGYFYLTPDFGMDYVRNCNGRGFHEHPANPPMFEKCPHVQVDKYSKVTIQDLRMHR